MIEDVEHGIVFIKTDFKSGISTERNVSENDTQTDRHKQQRLEVFLDSQPYKEYADYNHDQVACLSIGKTRIGEKLLEVADDKICKSHGSL